MLDQLNRELTREEALQEIIKHITEMENILNKWFPEDPQKDAK